MSAGQCREAINHLLEYSCTPQFAGQMQVARELFELATGKVNDDDPFYNDRMLCFQEYFVFDYRLTDVFPGATVVEHYILQSQSKFSLETLNLIEEMRSNRHSLFMVEKFKDGGMWVRDLIGRRVEFINPLPDYTVDSFELGSCFEARMISFKGTYYLTGAFIFHPREVLKVIEEHVKDFLMNRAHFQNRQIADWRTELKKRDDVLGIVAEQRKKVEQAAKKRSIDVLNVTKTLANTTTEISHNHLIMALGLNDEISPFVPESPFFDPTPLLYKLAFFEIKRHRYRHIDPVRIYSDEKWAENR